MEIPTLKQLAKTCGLRLEQVSRYLKLHNLSRSIQACMRGLGELIGRQRITEADLWRLKDRHSPGFSSQRVQRRHDDQRQFPQVINNLWLRSGRLGYL